MKKKLIVITIIIIFLILIVCIAALVNSSTKSDIKQQHVTSIKDTTEAYEEFDNLTTALLKNDSLEFKAYAESYTSLTIGISKWAPTFAKMAEMNDLDYIDNLSLKLQSSVVDVGLDVKELYFAIVDSKYFHEKNSYSDAELLSMQKDLREKMKVMLDLPS